MMSSENQAILEKANKAITEADYEGFLSYCTEDTKWTFVGDKTLQGKKAVRQYFSEAYIEPPVFEVEKYISEGKFLTAMGKISIKNTNGEMTDYLYCDVWRFEDSKLAELKAFVIEPKLA